MKSMFRALATAGALVFSAAPAFADDAPAAPPAAPAAVVADSCGCCPQTCCDRGIVVWAEALYMKFHPANPDWAATADATARPTGVLESKFDYELGLRGGIAYVRPGGTLGVGVQVTWANPDTSAEAAVVAPNFIGLTHGSPSLGLGFAQGGRVTHQESFDYLVVDAGFCSHSTMGCSGSSRLYAGARFAKIDHSIQEAAFNAAGAQVESLDSSTELTGFGLAMGGELRWGFCAGWSVWGKAASGILLSSIDATVLNTNGAGGVIVINTSTTIDRITPFVEMGLGFGWGCPRFMNSCIGVQVDVGFELTNWFNVLDPQSFVDDIRDSEFDEESDDLGISAFSLKLTLTF